MSQSRSPDGIDCPIDLFPKQEREVVRLTQAINQARTAAEKARPAQALVETVDVLLDCAAYDADNVNCNLCRNFSELRRKTAQLIVTVGNPARG